MTQDTRSHRWQTAPQPDIQARPDIGREHRRGIPEVILAQSKSTDQVITIARHFLGQTGRALVSRIDDEKASTVVAAFPGTVRAIRYEQAQALILAEATWTPTLTGGHIGLITAGTSDIPVADEARFIAEAMGCRVSCLYDVGVAGAHRLFEPLDILVHAEVDVIIVAAGMDGALPSLVSGLVPVPVIGLPTSIGYGMGGQGQGALLAMLQSCSPGLVLVNIDNGIGAGSTAALIANRVAAARRAHTPSAATAEDRLSPMRDR